VRVRIRSVFFEYAAFEFLFEGSAGYNYQGIVAAVDGVVYLTAEVGFGVTPIRNRYGG
jgi:hypothetical protein